MISTLSALLLGIVEGLTEFLPVSSTAHLAIAAELLHIAQTDFAKTFEIVIQSGAILAVLVLYGRKFLDFAVLKKILIAFIPTGVIGLIFYKLIKTYLLGNFVVMLSALFLGGVFLILFEHFFRERASSGDIGDISDRQALAIGLFQSVAMIPGVSRAAATIVGGLAIGLKREAIVEFSFLLAVPTMLAATALDLYKNYTLFSQAEFSSLAVGFAASFVTALIAIKILLKFIKTHTFTWFGVYRIALVLALLAFGAGEFA